MCLNEPLNSRFVTYFIDVDENERICVLKNIKQFHKPEDNFQLFILFIPFFRDVFVSLAY